MAAFTQRTVSKRRVMVVDDDEIDRQRVVRYLSEDFEVVVATSAKDAMSNLAEGLPDCVLLNFDRGAKNSMHLMPGFIRRNLAVVVYSGQGDETLAAMTYRLGGSDYLMKDRLSPEVLSRAIDKAICRSSVRCMVAQSLAYRKTQSDTRGKNSRSRRTRPLLIGETGISGTQVKVAQDRFLEIVDCIAKGGSGRLTTDLFSKSRVLAHGLGELGVESSEVLLILKEALIVRIEHTDLTEMQLYIEACQAAALDVMAHLSDFYRQAHGAGFDPHPSLN